MPKKRFKRKNINYKSQLPLPVRRFLYVDSGEEDDKSVLDIDPDSIPTLISDEQLKVEQEGDDKPYYKIEKIDYPVLANGVLYRRSFFEEYLGKCEISPINGSKDGHHLEWGKRPPSDFQLIGGKIVGGETGSVYLKHYIPPVGDNGSCNKQFIKDCRNNKIHFSLVSYTRDLYEEDPATGETKITAIGSIKGERNDAVERYLGAMEQKTNANKSIEISNKGEEIMEIKDMINAIHKALNYGNVDYEDVVEGLGLGDKMVNADHLAGAKLVDAFKKMNVEDPVAEITKLREKIASDKDAVFNAKLDAEFGASKKDATGAETNALRQCAEVMIDKTANADEAIKAFKETAAAKQLAGMLASTDDGVVVNSIESAAKVNSDEIKTEVY